MTESAKARNFLSMVDLWSDDHLQETLMAGPTRLEPATSGVTGSGRKIPSHHLAIVFKGLDNTTTCHPLPQKPIVWKAAL
jgi:hypothetical protein